MEADENTEEKPKRVTINFVKMLKRIAGEKLEVDVPPGERLCGACGGLGIVAFKQKYGLSDGKNEVRFPYQSGTFIVCPHCYYGVVKVCKHCGADIPGRQRTWCNCEAAQQERDDAQQEKRNKEYQQATRIEPDSEEARGMGMLWYDCSYNEGFFRDMDEFLEWWEDEHDKDDPRPEYVWATDEFKPHLDAESLISNMCEDLHEDAIDAISDESKEELASFLESWCEKQSDATSYVKSSTVLVRIPWEDLTWGEEEDGDAD